MKNKLLMTLTKLTGRTGLKLQQHSPTILIGVGIVAGITATVLACKSTLKAVEILKEHEEAIEKIEKCKDVLVETYTEADYKQDRMMQFVKTGASIVKVYAPAIILGAVAISSFVGSYYILNKRSLGLMAAYKALDKTFEDYRSRVTKLLGSDKELDIKKGLIMEETNENGQQVGVFNKKELSEYSRIFDESSIAWSKAPGYNYTFLKCQQSHANDLLRMRGHVFLNEVYDLLGMPRTQAGAVVGWVKGHGDDFIDFNMEKCEALTYDEHIGCNPHERSWLLDFNVEGVIYNMI